MYFWARRKGYVFYPKYVHKKTGHVRRKPNKIRYYIEGLNITIKAKKITQTKTVSVCVMNCAPMLYQIHNHM